MASCPARVWGIGSGSANREQCGNRADQSGPRRRGALRHLDFRVLPLASVGGVVLKHDHHAVTLHVRAVHSEAAD
jgi:hypothetical protein